MDIKFNSEDDISLIPYDKLHLISEILSEDQGKWTCFCVLKSYYILSTIWFGLKHLYKAKRLNLLTFTIRINNFIFSACSVIASTSDKLLMCLQSHCMQKYIKFDMHVLVHIKFNIFRHSIEDKI